MDKEKLRKQADWTLLEKRPSWGTATTAELSEVLKVSITNLNQWKLRNQIPPPEPRQKGKGNKNRWVIASFRSWLECRPEIEIHREFIDNHMDKNLPDVETAMLFASKYWDIYDLDKPSRY